VKTCIKDNCLGQQIDSEDKAVKVILQMESDGKGIKE